MIQKIVVVGDLMQHIKQLDAENATGFKYENTFADVKDMFADADAVIGNLETTISTLKYSGFPKFRAPVQFLTALKHAGFTTLVTANNHILDYDELGLFVTASHLLTQGITNVGTMGIRSVEVAENVHLHAATLISNNKTPSPDIEYYKPQGFILRNGFNIAYLHGGVEYQTSPTGTQRAITAELWAQGFDLVIWAHSHVCGPIEQNTFAVPRQQKYVAYGLGNFISDQENLDEQLGNALEITLNNGKMIELANVNTMTQWLDGESVVKGLCKDVIYQKDSTHVIHRNHMLKNNFVSIVQYQQN